MTEKNIPAISVIIPMYNAEKYIGECLDSILAQTFTDYEIIVVDDCSKDNSAKVVESYIPKFNGKLQLVRLEVNSGGAGTPRNNGLKIARGEYVFFMDSDDAIISNSFEKMYSFAKEFNADVVYCEKFYLVPWNEREVYKKTYFNTSYGQQHGGFVDKPTVENYDFATLIKKFCSEHFEMPPWDKLVRRNILLENNIKFPLLKVYDDFVWSFKVLCCAKKILRVPEAFYMYRQNTPGSVTGTKDTVEKTINFWMNPVINGLKILDDFMTKINFFVQNPEYRYGVLNLFAQLQFKWLMYKVAVPPYMFFDIVYNGEGQKLNEANVLVSYLLSNFDYYRRSIYSSQQNNNKLQENLQKSVQYLRNQSEIIDAQRAEIEQLKAQLQQK